MRQIVRQQMIGRHGGPFVVISAVRQGAEKRRLGERQFPSVASAKRESVVIRTSLDDIQWTQRLAVERVVADWARWGSLANSRHRQNGQNPNGDGHDPNENRNVG